MKKIEKYLLPFLVSIITANPVAFSQQAIQTNVHALNVEVSFVTPDIVRVYKTPEHSTFVKKSHTVILNPQKTDVEITENGEIVRMESAALTVSLDKKTGKVAFFSPDGQSLFTEKPYGAQFSPFDDAGNATYTARQAFLLEKEEAVYGLGQHPLDYLNQRNRKVLLKQRYYHACLPVFQSIKGYGVLWDNYSETTYNDNPQELSLESIVGESIDYYFMYGKSGDGTIAKIRELTGQAPMFPLWTFGFWQSRERYKSQYELTETLDKYRELRVPIDGIIQDWQYWGSDSLWNAMEFLNPDFPEPQKMIDHVHKQNAHIMISIWPTFGPETQQFKDLQKMNALFEFYTWPEKVHARVLDVYNPAARDLYWNYLKRGLYDKGIDAWWMDGTEPEVHFEKKEDYDFPTAMGTYRSVSNLFPLMTTAGVYEHQRATTSDKRVFILTRCAFTGQQRYATEVWSGDVQSTWQALREQIPTGLNFSLSGIPYWNTDIGGFFNHTYEGYERNAAYRELYSRWFQYATFTPMQRSHGSNSRKEIFNFGEKGDWAYDNELKYINLRYRLLPYLYSTAWDVTNHSGSFLRALFMDFAADRKTHDVGNQYMFGRSFLVAPVTEPMYVTAEQNAEGQWVNPKEDFAKAGRKQVYLPQGTDWFDFWTGEKHSGGQTVHKETPIDILPLYVRSGSIIPWGPDVQYATEKQWNALEIRIYTGSDGQFTLYEDENDNYNYEKGAYSTIDFRWNDRTKTLTIGERKGTFKGMLKNRKFRIVGVDKGKGIGVEETLAVDKTIDYNGKTITIVLNLLPLVR